MFRSLCFAMIAATAMAQSSSSNSVTSASSDAASQTASASSTSTQPITHTVGVAKGGFTFSPDVTLANVGDFIEFDFYPTNHSVIRAEYKFPCIPYEDTGVDKIGFFSGFRPVDAILPDPPKFTIRVNDTNPIFYYCGAEGSCIGHQMVGVINPNASTSLVTQKELASESTFMLLPGQPWPSEEDDPFTTTSSSSTSAPTSTATSTSSPAAATTATIAAHNHSGLGAGPIAGIAIGAAVVVLIAAVLIYLAGRNSRRHSHLLAQQQVPYSPSQGHISYTDPSKHMSVYSGYVSNALPGYNQMQPHDSNKSHASYPVYAASDVGNEANKSPNANHAHTAAPIHGNMQPPSTISTPHQSIVHNHQNTPPPNPSSSPQLQSFPPSTPPIPQQPSMSQLHSQAPENQIVHEMPAPGSSAPSEGGILKFIRNSSIDRPRTGTHTDVST